MTLFVQMGQPREPNKYWLANSDSQPMGDIGCLIRKYVGSDCFLITEMKTGYMTRLPNIFAFLGPDEEYLDGADKPMELEVYEYESLTDATLEADRLKKRLVERQKK